MACILKCPYCKSGLTEAGKKRYETMIEHISEPNMEEHPLRKTYECNCEEGKHYFWGYTGEVYTKETSVWEEVYGKWKDAIIDWGGK